MEAHIIQLTIIIQTNCMTILYIRGKRRGKERGQTRLSECVCERKNTVWLDISKLKRDSIRAGIYTTCMSCWLFIVL